MTLAQREANPYGPTYPVAPPVYGATMVDVDVERPEPGPPVVTTAEVRGGGLLGVTGTMMVVVLHGAMDIEYVDIGQALFFESVGQGVAVVTYGHVVRVDMTLSPSGVSYLLLRGTGHDDCLLTLLSLSWTRPGQYRCQSGMRK
jgi:hypothetical protein